MRSVLIFGGGDIAELAAFYFERLGRTVAAFTADRAFVTDDCRFGRPFLPFDEAIRRFPPDEHDGFVALSYAQMNVLRTEKAAAMQQAGYVLASYVSPQATVLTETIGENCFILEDNTLQPFCRIGNNVTLWSGNHIGHHSVVEDNVFISSHVVVSGRVVIGRNSFVGVNTTIVDHVTVAPFTLLGAGCIVQSSTDPEGVYAPSTGIEKRKVPSTRLKKF